MFIMKNQCEGNLFFLIMVHSSQQVQQEMIFIDLIFEKYIFFFVLILKK